MNNNSELSTTDPADDELLLQLALHFMPGIGPVLTRNLVSYSGSVEGVFHQKKSHLEKIPGIGRERAQIILSRKSFLQAEKELAYIKKNNVKAFFYPHPSYPERLKQCYDAPVILFFKGNTDLNARRMVAIVGTRHISSYGKNVTEEIIRELQSVNITIVSGLAYGIDSAAHRAAMNFNIPTIGVIAHGLEKMYPADNRQLASNMISNGGLISEYAHDTKAEKDNFPARNRIVAGLSDAIIVVESALRGGALITAAMANDYNRDVFAVPGRSTDLFSQGCNRLIRDNRAALIENGSQFLQAMNWIDEEKKEVQATLQFTVNLTAEEESVVNILKKNGKMTLDDLALASNQHVSKLSTMLLTLEFSNIVRPLPGKVFELASLK